MSDSSTPSVRTLARSFLFVPGLRPERIGKALDSGAHAVIVDLEDAVGTQEKPAAREQVARWLAENPSRRILLRINAAGTPWHADDLVLASALNVVAVVVPKAECAESLPDAGDKPLLPIIESARGFAQLEAIAAHPRVNRLIFGTYDFRTDLGIGSEPEALLYFSSRLVVASRVSGIWAPVDGVTTDLVNDAGWVAEARRAKSLGFGGKLCIHPRQVAAVNEGFAPSEDEIRWAMRIVEAVGDKATAVVDGEFVDRPIILRARGLLAARQPSIEV